MTIVGRVLVRAPLLPLEDWARGEAVFQRGTHAALARAALEIASPRAAQGGAKAARALASYARRAAFRPTPHGLWAGVGVLPLGARTRIETGAPRAHLTVAWARLAALGRALLETPEGRERARLRVAPSLLHDGRHALWLAFGDGAEAEAREAEVDALLHAVLDACAAPRPWAEVRRAAAAREDAGDEALDELLLALVDDGLLCHDLQPPLVGPEPLAWMRARLSGWDVGGALDEVAQALAEAEAAPDTRVESARAALSALPGQAAPDLHAVLVQDLRGTVARAAVERAAQVAPLLFRLQEALAPPSAERELDARIAETLEAVTEVFGAGALDLGALARGDYGTPLQPPAGHGAVEPGHAPAPEVLAFLAEALVWAGREGVDDLALDPAALDAVLPPAAPPPTFELVLQPAREPRGAKPGTGWLLGLHAPAGASWGRYAVAVGDPLVDALAELAEAERAAHPEEARLDVAWAPAPSLADLATHPPVRDAALALSTWADGAAVPAARLELVAGGDTLGWRAAGRVVVPSPLQRIRSTMAPAGPYRLLVAHRLHRQHAPWALHLGPLQGLERLPRLRVDGFVVAPASFRLPAGRLDGRALARWRKDLGVPRRVQIGREDELLLVDLDEKGAAETVTRLRAGGATRAFEVWPPLDEVVDAGGRRVELVAAVVGGADRRAAAEVERIAAAGPVTPPRWRPAAPGWRTLKLFGAPGRAEAVLSLASGVVRAARRAGALSGWFFLRYVDPPGRRDHLRLRLHGEGAATVEAQVLAALLPARAAGDLVTVETAEYHREYARYGTDAMPHVERVFESDSELACDLAALDETAADGVERLVLGLDALAAGLGFDTDARLQLASRRRAAVVDRLAPHDAALAEEYRARQARLYDRLVAPPQPFVAHIDRLTPLRDALPEARWTALLPALLHLVCARLIAPDPDEEARAYYLWQRALESLAARRGGAISR